MILSIRIENFRSIKNSVELKFSAEKRLKELELPFNTFTECDVEILRRIENSDSFKHDKKLEQYEPFLFDNNTKAAPVKFEIDFISAVSKIKFNYLIEFSEFEILKESLYFYPEGVISKLYDRNKGKITYGDYYKGAKKSIEDNLLANQLFLSKASTNKIAYLDEVYLFFTKYLYVATVHDTEYDHTIIKIFTELAAKNEKLKHNLLELLKAADTNIHDFTIVENKDDFKFPENFPDEAKKQLLDRFKYDVRTSHILFENGKELGFVPLKLEEESLGTKKFLAIGSLVLDTLAKGGVIVIDELDKGLHPLLTKMLINLFNSKENNPENAQLIFATHDSTLLDTEILRRDQICFIEKEYEGGSFLYKLSDIKGVRKNIPLDKWYLSGRFRAIPVVSDIKLKF